MGKLRDKAEAEVAERRREDLEHQEQIDRERQEREADLLPQAAAHLAEWSGEKVEPKQLARLDGEGPPRWLVALDGFQLEVVAIDLRHRVEIEVHQRLADGETRPVLLPADLLETEGKA